MKKLAMLRITSLAVIFCSFFTLPATSQLKTADVSPDMPYLWAKDVSPSGRIYSIVIDPSNKNVLYAASEWAGVWKSTDFGQSWSQASTGLRTGITQFDYPKNISILAIDDLNPYRLLYVTEGIDGRRPIACWDGFEDCNFGGLWVSTNAAGNWTHVDFDTGVATAACHNAVVDGVGFALGQPFVLTRSKNCMLLTSSDPALLSWTILPDPPLHPTIDIPMALGSGGDPAANRDVVMFACEGTAVYRKVNPASPTPPWEKVDVGGPFDCVAVTAVPAAPGVPPTKALAVFQKTGASDSGVSTIDFLASNFSTVDFSTTQGSGAFGVWAPRRPTNPSGQEGPEKSYDLYAANGLNFFRWTFGQWRALPGLHVDTWTMAFPSSYDPTVKNCDAFAGDDGGVSFHYVGPFGGMSCQNFGAQDGWGLASSGLHVTFGMSLAGLSRPRDADCLLAHPDGQPCPALYVASTDTDTWMSKLGGEPQYLWQPVDDGLGDANKIYLDPAAPEVALGVRNAFYTRLLGSNGQPPQGPWKEATPPYPATLLQAPAPSFVAQVMTVPGEPPQEFGDYLAVTSTYDNDANHCKETKTCGPDNIFRSLTLGDPSNQDLKGSWDGLAKVNFPGGHIGGIYASEGHTFLTVYVLTNNKLPLTEWIDPYQPGQIWTGTVDDDGFIRNWTLAMGQDPLTVSKAYNVFVNPFDPTELYAVDLGGATIDHTIKGSRDGGQTWAPIPTLKNIATNYGEFDFDCGDFGAGTKYRDKQIFGNECPLADVVFVRDAPEIRFAILYPGGVAFSRDYGVHWMPLNVTHAKWWEQPIELPHSGFYDPLPNFGGDTSLFIALEGKGVKRVTGPFPRLQGGALVYCPTCQADGFGDSLSSVSAYILTLDQSIPLRLDADGYWRGDVLFSYGEVRAIDFQFIADGNRTRIFHHEVSDDERASGVTVLTNEATRDLQ